MTVRKPNDGAMNAVFTSEVREYRIRALKRALDILEMESDNDDCAEEEAFPLSYAIQMIRREIWSEFDRLFENKKELTECEWHDICNMMNKFPRARPWQKDAP